MIHKPALASKDVDMTRSPGGVGSALPPLSPKGQPVPLKRDFWFLAKTGSAFQWPSKVWEVGLKIPLSCLGDPFESPPHPQKQYLWGICEQIQLDLT